MLVLLVSNELVTITNLLTIFNRNELVMIVIHSDQIISLTLCCSCVSQAICVWVLGCFVFIFKREIWERFVTERWPEEHLTGILWKCFFVLFFTQNWEVLKLYLGWKFKVFCYLLSILLFQSDITPKGNKSGPWLEITQKNLMMTPCSPLWMGSVLL